MQHVRRKVGVILATAFGAGYSPVAPGTAGTLAAVPLAWALGRCGSAIYALASAAVTLAAFWAASQAEEAFGEHDSKRIVIDEVVGYLVTLLLVPKDPANLLLGFLAFRLFDIWKPPPVRQIDERVGGGTGVVLDDIAAGVYAGVLLFLLHRLGVTQLLT